MFFDDLKQIPQIATHTECSIFVLPDSQKIELKHALTLEPNPETKTQLISVEQVREFIALTNSCETNDRFFVIRPADAMNEAAQNAFLKTLEEPKDFCHFVLITEQPTALLPTILSRAQVFFLRTENPLDTAPAAKEKIMTLAKRLVAASPKDLPEIALEITKSKTEPRATALAVTSTTIELLYKSYFKTGNPKFLTKLPGFITLYDNLSKNGHIKLHLVADLLQ